MEQISWGDRFRRWGSASRPATDRGRLCVAAGASPGSRESRGGGRRAGSLGSGPPQPSAAVEGIAQRSRSRRGRKSRGNGGRDRFQCFGCDVDCRGGCPKEQREEVGGEAALAADRGRAQGRWGLRRDDADACADFDAELCTTTSAKLARPTSTAAAYAAPLSAATSARRRCRSRSGTIAWPRRGRRPGSRGARRGRGNDRRADRPARGCRRLSPRLRAVSSLGLVRPGSGDRRVVRRHARRVEAAAVGCRAAGRGNGAGGVKMVANAGVACGGGGRVREHRRSRVARRLGLPESAVQTA